MFVGGNAPLLDDPPVNRVWDSPGVGFWCRPGFRWQQLGRRWCFGGRCWHRFNGSSGNRSSESFKELDARLVEPHPLAAVYFSVCVGDVVIAVVARGGVAAQRLL
jgi:hypothetical protein